MSQTSIGEIIAQRRKMLGITQQKLADCLNISFQAISKWEQGQSMPDILLLPRIAEVLGTSVDGLLGYVRPTVSDYDRRYKDDEFYWGIVPSKLCFEIMKLRPPIKPYRVLDIGCGEGKDAVFLAKNGYIVSAFDVSETGIEKARKLAKINGVTVDFFVADINDYVPDIEYDIVFSSGVFHYLSIPRRRELIDSIKESTVRNGINVINVFVRKPFIEPAPDSEMAELEADPWLSGELAQYYHDWLLREYRETVFPCSSGGKSHEHCMNVMIAEKMD